MGAAIARVAGAVGGSEVLDRLAALSGSDFTSLMLEVARRRAANQTPAELMRRYRGDRFVRPADLPWRGLQQAEDLMANNLPPEFERVTLAPLVPFGTHSALGPVSQDKVVTAMRGGEVAADPTNALALEAACRRLTRPADRVRLAAFQRVVRAQPTQPGYFPHFGLLGLVTAGRDPGGRLFERESLTEQVGALVAGLAAAGLRTTQLALTPLSAAGETIAAAVLAYLAESGVELTTDNDRQSGRGYYRDLCYKLNVLVEGRWHEVGDGGFTDWAARLTASNKERLLIAGLGIDRLATFMADLPAEPERRQEAVPVKYVLFYESGEDAATLTRVHFAAHRARWQEFADNGRLVAIGPFTDRTGAMGVFATHAAAEEFAEGDPFVVNHVVRSWSIREWNEALLPG